MESRHSGTTMAASRSSTSSTGSVRRLTGRVDGSIQALTFSADGKVLASADADGSVAVWHVAAASLGEIFAGHSAAALGRGAEPGRDDPLLRELRRQRGCLGRHRRASARPTVRIRPGRADRGGRAPPPGITNAVAVTPDSSLFATSPGPGRVTLWHSRTLTPEARELRGPVGTIISLAFSRDGTLLAATGSDTAHGRLGCEDRQARPRLARRRHPWRCGHRF